MNALAVQQLMNDFDVFDSALLYHGYTTYMRDYELVLENHVGPAQQGTYSYIFSHCAEANVHTGFSTDVYRSSLDDRLLKMETEREVNGFVWAANWALIENGWHLVTDSPKAILWSEGLGIDMHEVVIESQAHTITLIFSSIIIQKITDDVDSQVAGAFIPLR